MQGSMPTNDALSRNACRPPTLPVRVTSMLSILGEASFHEHQSLVEVLTRHANLTKRAWGVAPPPAGRQWDARNVSKTGKQQGKESSVRWSKVQVPATTPDGPK